MIQKDKTLSREILNKVSRTFALNIPLLDDNKVAEVENQYLLMRFVDTIEDSDLPLASRREILMAFSESISSRNYDMIEKIANEVRDKNIGDNDRFLMDNIGAVLRVFDSFDKKTKDVSIKWLCEMSFGMYNCAGKTICSFANLNEYCYYVAGTVGLYLNDLVSVKDGVQLKKEHAIKFGLFLQKVNIIRDFYKDNSEGRQFWPSELFGHYENAFDFLAVEKNIRSLEKMCDNAFKDSKETFDYISSIPDIISGYRKFCVLPAVIALKTLNLLYNNSQVFSETPVKVGRHDIETMISNTLSGEYTNERLRGILDSSYVRKPDEKRVHKLVIRPVYEHTIV